MYYTYLKNSHVEEVATIISTNYKNVVDSWVMNGFGMLVVDAVRPLEEISIPNIDNNILIRKADITDLIDMEHIFKGLDKHLSSSPIYLYNHISDNYIDKYGDWLKTEGNNLWIAEINNKIIGYLKGIETLFYRFRIC